MTGEARAILAVLEVRGLTVPAAVREAVMSCLDLAQLGVWVRAAVAVPRAEALLAPAATSSRPRKRRGGA